MHLYAWIGLIEFLFCGDYGYSESDSVVSYFRDIDTRCCIICRKYRIRMARSVRYHWNVFCSDEALTMKVTQCRTESNLYHVIMLKRYYTLLSSSSEPFGLHHWTRRKQIIVVIRNHGVKAEVWRKTRTFTKSNNNQSLNWPNKPDATQMRPFIIKAKSRLAIHPTID